MAGKSPVIRKFCSGHGYTSLVRQILIKRCRTCLSACRAVSNRFFFLQFAPGHSIGGKYSRLRNTQRRRKWRKQRGREKLSRIAGRRLWSKGIKYFPAHAVKKNPQAQQAHQRMPLEGNGALLQPGSRRHGERKRAWYYPHPKPAAAEIRITSPSGKASRRA